MITGNYWTDFTIGVVIGSVVVCALVGVVFLAVWKRRW